MADSLLVKLGLDNTAFERGIGKVGQRLRTLNNTLKLTGAAFGVAFGIGAVRQFAYQISDITKEAEKLGMSTSAFMEMREKAIRAGDSITPLDEKIKSLKKSMGSAFDPVRIDECAAAVSQFSDAMESLKGAILGGVIDAWDRFAGGVINTIFNAKDGYEFVKKRRKEAVEKQRELNAEQMKEIEAQKALKTIKELQKKFDDARNKNSEKLLSASEKLLLNEMELADLERESDEMLNSENVNYKRIEEIAKRVVDLRTENLDLADAEKKEAEDRIKAEKDFLDKKESLENRLNDLYDQRKKILDDITKKTKDALDATMQLIGDKGRGQTKQKMDKSAKYAEKAETAKAQGRMNDYFRYSKKSEEYKDKAVGERRDMLQRKGREALKKGDRETFDKLKDEYNKEGFGKGKPDDEQAKKLDKIADETEKTRKNLDKLVNGLQGE